MPEETIPVIVVHGGAGPIPETDFSLYEAGVKRAAEEGYKILIAGGSALDAVERTVFVMEEDEVFNAGRGSALTIDGEIEMDASIMDGKDLRCGMVSAIKSFLHPISIARKLLETGGPTHLTGQGAMEFALAQGFEEVPEEALITDRQYDRYNEKLKRLKEAGVKSPSWGTVGAVALDKESQIAAATSTGGKMLKMRGRVGDSAMIGAGTYADSRWGGVSCSGDGESIVKLALAARVMAMLEKGYTAEEAAEKAVKILEAKIGRCPGGLVHSPVGDVGIIVLDREGTVGTLWNTPKMATYVLGTGLP